MKTRRFSQFLLIKIIKNAGYNIDEKGICNALTLMWIQSALIGEEEKFIDRLIFLESITPDLEKKLGLFKMNSKELAEANLSADEKNKLIDLTAFINSIVIYHQPQKFPHLLGKQVSQKDVEESTKLASSIESEKRGKLASVYSESKSYNKNELTAYLNKLKNLLAKYSDGENKLMLTFSSFNHTIGVSFDPVANKCRIMNSEKLPPFDVNADDIADQIFAAFPTWNFKPKDNIFINARVYTTGFNPQLAAAISDFSDFKEQNELSDERARRIDDETGVTLAHIAAQNGDVALITELAEKGVNLNAVAGKEDYTAAMYAIQNGDIDMLKILAEKGTDFNIKSNDWPLICIAASLGQTAMLNILINYKADVNEPNSNGDTAAFFALLKGDKAAIKILMNAGAIFNLPNKEKNNPILLLLEKKSFDLAVYLMLGNKNMMEFDKKTLSLLERTRIELSNSFIKLMKNEANLDNKKNMLLKVVKGENPLGRILNQPVDPFLFTIKINPRKFEGRPITHSIENIIDAFPEIFDKPGNTNSPKGDKK